MNKKDLQCFGVAFTAVVFSIMYRGCLIHALSVQ